jgi:DNA modification methylase
VSVRVLIGDCRSVLATLPDRSVQTCVTSPPYWGLRDYGTATWEGGDAGCDHRKVVDTIGAVATSTLGGGKKTTGHIQEGFKGGCGRCGAVRVDSQIGLEKTPDEYVAKMVAVFREVRRVLRDDGTLWLNLGDSYVSTPPGKCADPFKTTTAGGGKADRNRINARESCQSRPPRAFDGLKPKDLVGIPWRVAFALQADGWYLRSDIIWHKPNPMPESVTDRPTKAHEYLFLLTKQPTYYYDADAVREPFTDERMGNPGAPSPKALVIPGQSPHTFGRKVWDKGPENGGRNRRTVWTVATPMWRLRSDLTAEQRAYVLRRIAGADSPS